MSDTTRSIRAIYLAVIIACIVVSLTGAKAGQKDAGLKVAMVDMPRVNDEYKATVDAVKEFNRRLQDLQAYVDVRRDFGLLVDADMKELTALMVEERTAGQNFEPAKKKRKMELEEKHRQLIEELTQLQQKPQAALNQQEKDRMSLLQRSRSDAQAEAVRKANSGQEELNKLREERLEKINKDIRESVTKIAKEKGVSVLFMSNVVAYCENDLTDAVLGNLNKK